MPARISITACRRAQLLTLPDNEVTVAAHYSLDAGDLATIGTAHTPATRLGYAL